MATLAEQLTALSTMSPMQLRAEWRRLYRNPPPRLTPDLLQRGLAYRLQERAQGGLPAGIARELDSMARRLERGERARGQARGSPEVAHPAGASERIRDKIAASNLKGLWMGGPVPLGYDVLERKLVVNPSETATVRHIFDRYLELGSVVATAAALNRDGVTTKLTTTKGGGHRGGIAWMRGGLAHLLGNRV